MRRSIEEKLDLYLVSHSYLLFLLFLFSFNLLTAQINTNGFLNVDKIDIQPEYNRIYDLDYDKDKLIDLLLFNKSNREYTLIRNLFTNSQRILTKKFWIDLSSIANFIEVNNINYYLLTSRKDKSVSLVYFTNYGSLIIKDRLKLNSFPSSTITADFNNDGKLEAVVFGPSFNGLSLIKEKKFVLSQTIITDKESYNQAFSDDFNGDNFLDIIAFNSISNSFEIFLNDHEGNFYSARKFNLETNEKFQIYSDINNDGFSDIITSNNKLVNIYFSDSVYSFTSKQIYNFDVPIKKIITADLNYNNVSDLIFINSNSDKIYASFSDINGKYQKPICILNGENFEDIKITRKGILNRLLAVDSSGKLFAISYLNNNVSNFGISLSDSLSNIFSFENLIGAVSPAENKFYILKNENYSLYFSDYSLTKSFKNVFIDKHQSNYNFYFYNKSDKLVELIELDSTLTFKQKTNFYFKNGIEQIIKDKSTNKITAFLNNRSSLTFSAILELKNKSVFKTTDDYLVSADLLKFSVCNSDTVYITYINNENNKLTYNLSKKHNSLYKDAAKVELGLAEEEVSLSSFIRNGYFFSIVNLNKSKEYLVQLNNSFLTFRASFYFDPEKLRILNYRNSDRFIYFDESTNEIRWIKTSISRREFLYETLLKNINATDFTFFLYNDMPMIVYFDINTNLLKFKRIPFND